MPPEKRQAIQDRMAAIVGQLTRLSSVFDVVEQESCLPSAIDDLMSGKRIGEMTADEYVALVLQAKAKIKDVERLRRQVRGGIDKCRVAAKRGTALIELLEAKTAAVEKRAKKKRA